MLSGGKLKSMAYPNLKTATKEELNKVYPWGIFGACEKCGATWPENSIFGQECGDVSTPLIDAQIRSVLEG